MTAPTDQTLSQAIAKLLTPMAEWTALERQVGVALAKQNKGGLLNDGEIAIIEEYEAICLLKGFPTDYRNGEPMERWHDTIPQAAAAHNVGNMEVIRAKGAGCRAFRGRRIYSASLALWLLKNPQSARIVGRPSKCTPEVIDRIAELVRGGMFLEPAARKCGVSASVLYQWKTKGAAERKGRHRDFLEAMAEAEADGEHMLLERALIETPRAALEILQRRYRDRWAERREITGAGGDPLNTPLPAAPTVTINFKTDGAASPFVIVPDQADAIPENTGGDATGR